MQTSVPLSAGNSKWRPEEEEKDRDRDRDKESLSLGPFCCSYDQVYENIIELLTRASQSNNQELPFSSQRQLKDESESSLLRAYIEELEVS